MQFDADDVVYVHYKDRTSQIKLNFEGNNAGRDMATASLALELQAALNLATPPVGLRLRVAQGTEAVVCPLSVLIACPAYIATNFQGMSWFPLVEGGGDEGAEADSVLAAAAAAAQLPEPPTREPLLPPPLGSPLEHELSFLATDGSAGSPSDVYSRPFTAPAGDCTRGMRPRAGKEGFGRPMSATPSDKSCGMRRFRPGKSEGFGRPVTALPSDHSGSGSPAWGLGSPHGFRCEESAQQGVATPALRRPSTAPAFAATGLRRQSSSNLGSGSQYGNGLLGERFGRGGDLEVDEVDTETAGAKDGATHILPDGGAANDHTDASGGGGWCTAEPPRECWV